MIVSSNNAIFLLGLEMVDNSGIELMGVREVNIEAAAMFEAFGAQGTLVKAGMSMEKGVELEVAVMGCGEGTVRAAERWQEQRHSLVGKAQ